MRDLEPEIKAEEMTIIQHIQIKCQYLLGEAYLKIVMRRMRNNELGTKIDTEV